MAGSAVSMDVRLAIARWPDDAPRGAVKRFCAEHGISRSRFYEIRAETAGKPVADALAPRPRRSRPDRAIGEGAAAAALKIRKDLQGRGWDAGPLTVRHELAEQGYDPVPSRATLARLFSASGAVTPQPQKRPRSSYRRFTFAYVHECWQLDATEVDLGGGHTVVVFQLLDDHSRFVVASRAAVSENAADALAVFTEAVERFQAPQILLSDNGSALNPHRRNRSSPLVEAAHGLGTRPITGTPYHPQTQGKNERIHQTFKRWLVAQPTPASLAELAHMLDEFDNHYNHHRPHQALRMHTPAQTLREDAWAAPVLPPEPENVPEPPQDRTRLKTRRVAANGTVSADGSLIGIGVEHQGSDVHVLIEADTIEIFDARGTTIRAVEREHGTTYYPTGRPPGGRAQPRKRATITLNDELSGPTET